MNCESDPAKACQPQEYVGIESLDVHELQLGSPEKGAYLAVALGAAPTGGSLVGASAVN